MHNWNINYHTDSFASMVASYAEHVFVYKPSFELPHLNAQTEGWCYQLQSLAPDCEDTDLSRLITYTVHIILTRLSVLILKEPRAVTEADCDKTEQLTFPRRYSTPDPPPADIPPSRPALVGGTVWAVTPSTVFFTLGLRSLAPRFRLCV